MTIESKLAAIREACEQALEAYEAAMARAFAEAYINDGGEE